MSAVAKGRGNDKKGKKKKKDPNAPKRPRSAYILYCQENRSAVKTANPDFKPSELMSKLGEMWKNLSKEDKQEFVEQAESDKERYNKERSNYKGPVGGDDDDDDSPKKKTKKVPKDPSQKKAKSGYLVFGDEQRPVIKKQNPDFKAKDIIAEIGRRWKALTESERMQFNEKAKKLKDNAANAKAKPAAKAESEEEEESEEEDDEEDEEDDD